MRQIYQIILGVLLATCSISAYAGGIVMMGGGVPVAAGDSCTGALLFSWHAENVDVTLGTPAGCSAGDTTGAAQSGATLSTTQLTDGTYSASSPTAADFYQFDAASIVDTSVGTATFDLYVDTWQAANGVFRIYTDANNYIKLNLYGTSDLSLQQKGGGETTTLNTTGLNLTADTWHSVVIKWRQGATDPTLSISIDGGTAQTSTTDFTAYSGSATYVQIGEFVNNSNGPMFIDNLKIYNTWN